MDKIEVFYKNGKREIYRFVRDWHISGDFFVIKENKQEYNILTGEILQIKIGKEEGES